MGKLVKRWLNALLVFCLLLVLLPTHSLATEIINSGYCGGEGDGTNLAWTFENDGTLTISGTGKMGNYDTEMNTVPWSANLENIQKVVINQGVSSIGDYAFYTKSHSKISSIVMPDSITSIGNSAFLFCDQLSNLELPDGLLSIGRGAFSRCQGLREIKIPDSVTSIGPYAFSGCIQVKTVTIPKNVSSIGAGVFTACSTLTEIFVDPQNKYFKSDMGALRSGTQFLCCPAGISGKFEIPQGITTIAAAAFNSCKKITDIVIPDTLPST